MIWGILFIVMAIALFAGFCWMCQAVCKFSFLQGILPEKKWKRRFCGAFIVFLLMGMLTVIFDGTNMVIIFLHLMFFWLFCELVAFLILKISGKKSHHYYAGICGFLLTFIWLGIGWYNAHHVSRTAYNLTVSKPLGIPHLKIVGLSDSHVGATFHWQEFDQYIDQINAENPDIVVIMGDFVDDGTSKEDMLHCCKTLRRLKTRYGVYYVYGNHDAGYFNNSERGYTLADLDKQLEANQVRILRDETVPVVGNIWICGRLDKSRDWKRKSASDLMKGNPESRYVICLDHEPNDYQAEEESKMDLVISGHTHGGQFVGMGTAGLLMGANDAYYGYVKRGNTDFIVSSGIADWAIKFKTGCISEYIVLDLHS